MFYLLSLQSFKFGNLSSWLFLADALPSELLLTLSVTLQEYNLTTTKATNTNMQYFMMGPEIFNLIFYVRFV